MIAAQERGIKCKIREKEGERDGLSSSSCSTHRIRLVSRIILLRAAKEVKEKEEDFFWCVRVCVFVGSQQSLNQRQITFLFLLLLLFFLVSFFGGPNFNAGC